MAETTDLVNYAFDKKPVEFADTFNQLVQQRAQEKVEAHRITLAQSIYGSDDSEDDVDVADDSDDADEDFEISDEDLDLDDFDLDGIDLDDDNEDFTDDSEDA